MYIESVYRDCLIYAEILVSIQQLLTHILCSNNNYLQKSAWCLFIFTFLSSYEKFSVEVFGKYEKKTSKWRFNSFENILVWFYFSIFFRWEFSWEKFEFGICRQESWIGLAQFVLGIVEKRIDKIVEIFDVIEARLLLTTVQLFLNGKISLKTSWNLFRTFINLN